MALNKFCCCCDLRQGCIVFAWLQMMGITLTIATCIAYSDILTNLVNIENFGEHRNADPFVYLYTISFSFKIYSAALFIKGVTCISLTWGVIKKQHFFYQPWLFISGVECCVGSIEVFILFLLTFFIAPIIFLVFILFGVITGLNWYFWMCVYTVYCKDKKPSSISYEMVYDDVQNSSNIL